MSETTGFVSANDDRDDPPRYLTAQGTVDLPRLTHDLRAPLNGVLGFAKLLHDGKAGPLGEQQKEFVADVLECGKELLKVVRRLEDESRR